MDYKKLNLLKNKNMEEESIYINEIIRINYKCNWSCKFCNVLKTNNYGENDVSSKEIINKIFLLTKKYTLKQRKNLILSLSGGEPTLNTKLVSFVKLAKSFGIGTVQIQTNGSILFKRKELIDELINAGLDEIFLAQHSSSDKINRELGAYYSINNFIDWIKYVKKNNLHKKLQICFNIVVNKINIFQIYEFIEFLSKNEFLDLLHLENNNGFLNTKRISFGMVQPNGYAEINKEQVLLKYTDNEIKEINKIIKLCKNNNVYPDLHFTAPTLCVLDYPEYNLEYQRLKQIEKDKKNNDTNESNLESYRYLWKEKKKFKNCEKCKYNNFCLGFYKNWINFVGEKYVEEKIKNFVY